MREISAQSAYCGQNDMRAHFGVGDATVMDSVRIEWPSGIVQHLTSVQVDQILAVKEEMVSSVPAHESPFDFTVYPNPTDSNIQISARFQKQVDQLYIEIIGEAGQRLYYESFPHVEAEWEHEVNLSQLHLSPGVYFLKLHTGLISEERKIIFMPR